MTTQTWTYPKEPPVGTIIKDNTGTQWERTNNKRWESWQSLTTPDRFATWNELLMGGSPLHEQPPRYKTGKQYLLNTETLENLPDGATILIKNAKEKHYVRPILQKKDDRWIELYYVNWLTSHEVINRYDECEKFTLIYQPE